jgi:hypothetical protein
MNDNAPYIMGRGPDLARALLRAGRWDEALAVLPAGETAARTEILADRFWWQLREGAEAEAAIGELASDDPVLAGFYGAQLGYTRLLFQLEPRAGDLDQARNGFAAAARDPRLDGWGAFWLGALADNIDHDPGAAAACYAAALSLSRRHADPLLESYAVRHQGDHAMASDEGLGLRLLRRSYYLRAALGARPQTAAAAVTLAEALPPGQEADQLRETAGITARELGLTWLLEEAVSRDHAASASAATTA